MPPEDILHAVFTQPLAMLGLSAADAPEAAFRVVFDAEERLFSIK